MPTRQDHDQSDVVLDLDEVNPKPIVITFKGNRFILKPIPLGEFLGIYQAFEKLRMSANSESDQGSKALTDNMVKSYADLFKAVCPEITRDMVKQMTITQINVLMTYIVKLIQGASDLKKND